MNSRGLVPKWLLLSVLIAGWLPFDLVAQAPPTLHVSPTGSDRSDGSLARPFRTIQHAIDAAARGAVVIVHEGRYAGAGNRSLDFHGKAVVVRSNNPSDPKCVAQTILDAEGEGVIVRFVNGEGPATGFGGFTLFPGDTETLVPGVPGYFEIASKARPTTWSLRLGKPVPSVRPTKTQVGEYYGAPVGGRAWDGNNPFFQPAATMDYYGSGDLNGDGSITSADILRAMQIVSGTMPASPVADVDGNGVIDTNDVTLITAAAGGGTLPAWWNQLTTRTQREAWIDKVLARDTTDVRGWTPWFQCGSFATQTFIHAALYRNDFFAGIYSGGQTHFNVPLYVAEVMLPTWGHSINAVLVGDNPLSFDDWRFIEPQDDSTVQPGMWDMPFGATVKLYVPNWIRGASGGFMGEEYKVEFAVSGTGSWSLTAHSASLVLTRPAAPSITLDNRPDFWNPRILPVGGGMLLLDRQRADMSRVDDLHLTDLPFTDPPSASPLTLNSEFSHLLDFTRDSGGGIRLLWRAGVPGPQYDEGVFTGVLHTATRTVSGATRLTPAMRKIRGGRIVALGNELHAFWFAREASPSAGYQSGVYWSRWTGASWTAEQLIAPVAGVPIDWGDWLLADSFRYIFDVTAGGDGSLVLVWCDRDGSGNVVLQQLRYTGSWSSASVIESTGLPDGGVALARDSSGYVHLAYWRGAGLSVIYAGYGYGTQVLMHRKLTSLLTSSAWSAPDTVDGGGYATSPRMVMAPLDALYLVWERYTGTQSVPVWKKYNGSGWSAEQVLAVPPGTDAHYPTVEVLPDFRVAFAWSSRSVDRATIEVAYAPPAVLSIAKTHTADDIAKGQTGVAYTVTVSNAASAGPTTGIVVVEDTPLAGLTLTSMSGQGWACSGNKCLRGDFLNPGSTYPPITVKVNVAPDAPSPVTNQANVSGGGSATVTVGDVAAVLGK